MGPWVHVRIVEPTRPRPIAELRLIDGDIPDQLLGTVDEAGAIRIVPRPDGEPWDLSLRELSQALWEAEDRLRDGRGPVGAPRHRPVAPDARAEASEDDAVGVSGADGKARVDRRAA